MAAVAGAAVPFSVTSAPCSAPHPAATAGFILAKPELPALPQYPPMGRYGSRLERVEAVSRFPPPRTAWSVWGDWGDDETGGTDSGYGGEQAFQPESIAATVAQPDHDRAVLGAKGDGNIYRQLTLWLRAHRQDAAMRELAQLRRVLVLVPADRLGQSWQAHLMCPAPPTHAIAAMRVPGAEGRSWPLRAEGAWAFTEPARRWQRWRMRQHLRADGAWQLEQSSEGQHTPAWCIDGAPQLLPTPAHSGIPLHLTEPQRLRRLLGTQWTVLVLRAPEPLPRR